MKIIIIFFYNFLINFIIFIWYDKNFNFIKIQTFKISWISLRFRSNFDGENGQISHYICKKFFAKSGKNLAKSERKWSEN